ncbi:hypothetical protein EDB89DRAFT_1117819 [Lactarius sanguifluus]|nr:hypothetical protein EDB89DRAFT_1117819 [Lactarius sanguifluus]
MSTQIKVFIPLLSTLCAYPHTISYVGELRRAIWNEESAPLRDRGGQFRQISLRSLVGDTFKNQHSNSDFPQVYPVPLEPENTLRKRVVDSARASGNRWADIKDGAKVPPGWCDPQNVHVYLYVDLGPKMRAAERLYDKLWGTDLSVILEETLPLSDLRMAEGSHSDMTSLMGTTWGRKRAAGALKGATRFGCPECVWERSANAVLAGWLYTPSREPPSSPLTLTPIATSPPGVAPRRAMPANSPGRS